MKHAVQRAWERYGMRIGVEDLARMKYAILNRDPTVVDLAQQNDGSLLIAIRYRHTWLAASTDGDGFIMSFLPAFILDHYRSELYERKRELRQLEYRGVGSP